MITRIGIIAGQIVSALEQEGKSLSARDLSELILEPIDEVLLTIGWLAHEKYVQVESLKGDCVIRLVPGGDLASFHNRLLVFNETSTASPSKPETILNSEEKTRNSVKPELSEKKNPEGKRLRVRF